jgi:hypothetical protein
MMMRRGTLTWKTQLPRLRPQTVIQPARCRLFHKAPCRSPIWVVLVLLRGGSQIYIQEQVQNFNTRVRCLNKHNAKITPTKKLCWYVSTDSSVAAMQLLIKHVYGSLPYRAGECQTGLSRCSTTPKTGEVEPTGYTKAKWNVGKPCGGELHDRILLQVSNTLGLSKDGKPHPHWGTQVPTDMRTIFLSGNTG